MNSLIHRSPALLPLTAIANTIVYQGSVQALRVITSPTYHSRASKTRSVIRGVDRYQRLNHRGLSAMATVKDTSDAPHAEYVRLGKSGLKVSVPILGSMSFGDSRWQPWVVEEDKVKLRLTFSTN